MLMIGVVGMASAAAVPANPFGASSERKEVLYSHWSCLASRAVIKFFSPSERLQALPDHARGTGHPLKGQASFPFPILPPKPQASGACPKCDEIYAEMWELRMRLGDWISPDFGDSGDVRAAEPVFNLMQNDMEMMCQKQNQNQYADYQWCARVYSGCYVATGNSTRLSPGQAVTCERVPFRHFAHAITAYALNGSDMHIEITGSAPNPYYPGRSVTLEVMVPNSWFVQRALDLHSAINALPTDAWHALKLGDNATGPAAPPYPSISEVFATLLTSKATEYIQDTAASWPWVPPPPPPPPTPPPCPGGSLQECMNLCPKTPMEDYKACVKACLDVCHTA
jgi:hypothetical protein